MKRKRKIGKAELVFILILLVGLSILNYPTFSDLYNKYRNSQIIDSYKQTVQTLDKKDYDKYYQEAKAYNDQHKVNTIVDAFNGEDYILTHPYDTLLNINHDNVMGYLEIPDIQLNLAIYHGTGAKYLEEGLGHVEGTSLPIGGKGTHSVIAGHRGLPGALLFTDLDQLEINDEFYIHVLDKTLAYKINQIEVVEPSEVDLLKIDKNEDYVTLVTCTPYGVNSHRLLIRGKRTKYHKPETSINIPYIMSTYYKLLLMVLGLLLFILILIVRYRKERKHET